MSSIQPIGIFDSGVGGLTVYRALRELLPHENFIYLADTARLPYGTRSNATVEQYTVDAAKFLRDMDIKFLVVACNTASALGLGGLQQAMPDLCYCGVISSGAEAAVKATKNGRITVLATEATIRSNIYADVIRSIRRDADVQMLATNLLVSLVEEGWWQGVEASAIVARYLATLKTGCDTLVLGCTHFPLLTPVICELIAPDVQIVDPSLATAHAVADLLNVRELTNPQTTPGADSFFVSDMPERFVRLAQNFLGRNIDGKVTEASF